MKKLYVKVGDIVKVIVGVDKGKIGEVSWIMIYNSKIIVKDINFKMKYVKLKVEGEIG